MEARLVTYNVQGLGAYRGVMPASSPELEARHKALGDTLKELDGDVVSLQEVPSKAALESFVAKQGLSAEYPYRRFFQTNDDMGNNHLAILSKHPIEESKSNRSKAFKIDGSNRPGHFTRDVAEARVNIGGYPLRVYNTHLKANPQIRRNSAENRELYEEKRAVVDDIRHGEGRALKDIIKNNYRRCPTEHFAVTMDANTTPQDSIIKNLTSGFAPAHDVIGDQPGFETHPSSHRRLDYILLSDGLAANYVEGSSEVPNTPRTRRGSDHNPAVLTVQLPDLPKV